MINLQTIDVPLSFVNAKNALSLPFLTTDTNTIEPYLRGRGVLRIYGGGSQIFFNFNQGVFYE
jgi:hypothetical protein